MQPVIPSNVTCWTSGYNKDGVFSKATCLMVTIDKDIEDYSKACTSCATAAIPVYGGKHYCYTGHRPLVVI